MKQNKTKQPKMTTKAQTVIKEERQNINKMLNIKNNNLLKIKNKVIQTLPIIEVS